MDPGQNAAGMKLRMMTAINNSLCWNDQQVPDETVEHSRTDAAGGYFEHKLKPFGLLECFCDASI